ncbi:hypothetical protein ACFWWC_47090 [Streptomyces sp. NPDC058642]
MTDDETTRRPGPRVTGVRAFVARCLLSGTVQAVVRWLLDGVFHH